MDRNKLLNVKKKHDYRNKLYHNDITEEKLSIFPDLISLTFCTFLGLL